MAREGADSPMGERLVKAAKKGYIWIMTDYLFARPSILEGIGRNIDLFGLMNDYNYSQNETEADIKALFNDWAAVYMDFYKAYNGMVCQVEAKKTGV